MKKILPLILAAAFMLSLVSCGSNSMDMDEMLEIAEPLDLETAMEQYDDNVVQAKEMYVGNTYTVSGVVTYIATDHCSIEPEGKNMFGHFYIYLSDDDMLKITKDETFSFVGEITDVNIGITMGNAYIVE